MRNSLIVLLLFPIYLFGQDGVQMYGDDGSSLFYIDYRDCNYFTYGDSDVWIKYNNELNTVHYALSQPPDLGTGWTQYSGTTING